MMQSWTDRLAHKLPSAERLKHIMALADLPFEPSTSMQRDLQKALSETIDMLSLMTAENVTLMRMGGQDKDSVSIMRDRIALLCAMQTGRTR